MASAKIENSLFKNILKHLKYFLSVCFNALECLMPSFRVTALKNFTDDDGRDASARACAPRSPRY